MGYAELEALIEQEKYEEAVALCQKAIASGAEPHFWKTQLGYVYFLDERNDFNYYTKSVEIFEVLVKEDEQDSNAHFWLGYFNTLILLDNQTARMELEQATALDPGHAYAYLVLAGIEGTEAKSRLKLLERVLELQPNNFRALHELAALYRTKQRETEANALLEIILKQQPYLEQSYGIMNRYINDVFTGANQAEALRAEIKLNLKEGSFPVLPYV